MYSISNNYGNIYKTSIFCTLATRYLAVVDVVRTDEKDNEHSTAATL